MNKNDVRPALVFLCIFFGWGSAAWYWYTCSIKNMCGTHENTLLFTNVTTAYDRSDATWEIVLMLTVSFLLGWFFRYLWSMRGIDVSTVPLATAVPAATVAPRPARFTGVREDNLQIVEGIGPKIEQLLKTHGIVTWHDLAHAELARLKMILAAGGERFQMHDPSNWADQAALALEDRWAELDEFQSLLTGGRGR